MKFAAIEAEKANYPVSLMCSALEVSRAGYYAWKQRGQSLRSRTDEQLVGKIREAHHCSRGTYGSPRIHVELREQGIKIGRHRVARLMRQQRLVGRQPARYRVTTQSNHDFEVAKNLLDRKFRADAPNRAWVTDITCLWTAQGWLYIAVILDLFSRAVVGWAMSQRPNAELALDALRMALERRNPGPGLLHHSDRGVQYACDAYQAALRAQGIRCSMSRKGNCWDNAPSESFFSTLKTELFGNRIPRTVDSAKSEIFDYIEVFYNRMRRHSTLGYASPVQFEAAA